MAVPSCGISGLWLSVYSFGRSRLRAGPGPNWNSDLPRRIPDESAMRPLRATDTQKVMKS